MTAQAKAAALTEPTAHEDESVDELKDRLTQLKRQLEELDARNLELEKLAARRGVKLSCANIALSRAKLAFDQSARRREEMVQEVAHDLRTPLTSIKGAAQNLLDGLAGPLDESAGEYVEIMRDHADRLIEAVNWLVEAMRVSSDPLQLDEDGVDLYELAEDVARGLRPIADERGIRLAVGPRPAYAISIVDGPKLRQVLENLVGNALKFTQSGGQVTVSVDEDSEELLVKVADSGVGMTDEEQLRIFERYYRSPTAGGGSGIGLAIAREVVRLHGGDITCRSEPDVGSEFVIRLPKDRPRF